MMNLSIYPSAVLSIDSLGVLGSWFLSTVYLCVLLEGFRYEGQCVLKIYTTLCILL